MNMTMRVALCYPGSFCSSDLLTVILQPPLTDDHKFRIELNDTE